MTKNYSWGETQQWRVGQYERKLSPTRPGTPPKKNKSNQNQKRKESAAIEKHADHRSEVRIRTTGMRTARPIIWCLECRKQVQFLTFEQWQIYEQIQKESKNV